MEEDEVVLSDVHLHTENSSQFRRVSDKSHVSSYNVCNSTFVVRTLSDKHAPETDEDGDLIVRRRGDNPAPPEYVICIEHAMATRLTDVGLQVWPGCLLLCDYILWKRNQFKDTLCVELGSGCGLLSIIVSKFARKIFATDIGDDVLHVCHKNLLQNESPDQQAPVAVGGAANDKTFVVKELNWNADSFIKDGAYGWTVEEISELKNSDFILAADVIYDEALTEMLFKTLLNLCGNSSQLTTIYMSLERRLNFTMADLDVACPAYEHYVSQLEKLIVHLELSHGRRMTARRLDTDFPQYMSYDRHKHLELWELKVT